MATLDHLILKFSYLSPLIVCLNSKEWISLNTPVFKAPDSTFHKKLVYFHHTRANYTVMKLFLNTMKLFIIQVKWPSFPVGIWENCTVVAEMQSFRILLVPSIN